MTTHVHTNYCCGVIAPAGGDEAGEPEGLTNPMVPPGLVTLSNVLGIQDCRMERV